MTDEPTFDRNRYFVRKHDRHVLKALAELAASARSGRLECMVDEDVDTLAKLLELLADWFDGDQHKRYFVLRYDCPNGEPADPDARVALAYYASLVESRNPNFAAELRAELNRTE